MKWLWLPLLAGLTGCAGMQNGYGGGTIDPQSAYLMQQNLQQAVNPYQGMPAYQPTQFHSQTTNCNPNYAGGVYCTTQGY